RVLFRSRETLSFFEDERTVGGHTEKSSTANGVMTASVDQPGFGRYDLVSERSTQQPVRPTSPPRTRLPIRAVSPAPIASAPRMTLRKKIAIAAIVVLVAIASVLGWRWVLIAATTEDAPPPESVAQPNVQPAHRPSPPPADLEVTVLEVRTAGGDASGTAAAR